MTGATPDGKDELAVYVIKKQPVVYAASVEEDLRCTQVGWILFL